MEPSGYVSWDDFTRPGSVRKQPRETVAQVVIGHALKSHFFRTIYEDRTVASLRDGLHDYAIGETPAKFNFGVLELLAGLTWIAGFGRSKQGLTRHVLGASVSFAIDEFFDCNWIGSPYVEAAAQRLDIGVRDYTAHAYTRPADGHWFKVNRERVAEKAAERLSISPDSLGTAAVEKLVTEQLASLEDLLDRYEVR